MASQPLTRISEQEYMALERAAAFRSEYAGGEIFAMAGGNVRHSALTVRASTNLSNGLQGKRCLVNSPDMRIRTSETGAQLYPDVSVVCGEPKFYKDSSDLLLNPVVIAEVLSPSTADYDRGKKFELYREIGTLKDYLLFHTDEVWVEHYSRQADGSWIFREHRGMDQSVAIPSIEHVVNLSGVYDGILDLPA